MAPPSQLVKPGQATIDIYVRMNDDCEKDYCFNAQTNKPARQLFKIIDALPMVLSPSYFYNHEPIGFAKSIDPGFLTSEGGLLFAESAKNTKPLDLDKPLKGQVYEGQLIVPIWEYNYTRFLGVLSVLLVWLYLDLPQFITPTPGIAPSTVIFSAMDRLLEMVGGEALVGAPEDADPSAFSGVPWQIGFFVFHILKVAVIYAIVWSGGINPYSFNPIHNRKMAKREIDADMLLEVGWTGARRATVDEWREENRKNIIERHGGVINAYNAGVLSGAAELGVKLNKGEGWDSEGSKQVSPYFVIDEKYVDEVRRCLQIQIDEIESLKTVEEVENEADVDEETAASVLAKALKRFRRIGPILGTDYLHSVYEKRKLLEKELTGKK